MALPASGTISFDQLQTEMGGSNPISLSEYYRTGSYVADIAQNASIPTSGTISLSNFYGGVGIFVFNQTISSDTANYNLNSAMTAAGWDGSKRVIATVTVNSGVTVYGSGAVGFTVGSLPASSTVNITNNGTIAGYGGGGGGYWNLAGGAGGVALAISYATTMTNNAYILGGGGGGGAGAANEYYGTAKEGAAGGAGGAAIQIYANLSMTNSGVIGGGGGGGGGGGTNQFYNCGTMLYVGGGGGAGGRTGSPIVPSGGGVRGGMFQCSAFSNTQPTNGENGFTQKPGYTPADTWTSGSPLPGSGGLSYGPAYGVNTSGGYGGRGGSTTSDDPAPWASNGRAGQSTAYGGGAGGAGGRAVILSAGTFSLSGGGAIYGAYT